MKDNTLIANATDSQNLVTAIDRVGWARHLEKRSFLRYVLYGTALSAGFHIALAGVAVNSPQGLITDSAPTQSIDLVVVEPEAEPKIEVPPVIPPQPALVSPPTETVYIPPTTPVDRSRVNPVDRSAQDQPSSDQPSTRQPSEPPRISANSPSTPATEPTAPNASTPENLTDGEPNTETTTSTAPIDTNYPTTTSGNSPSVGTPSPSITSVTDRIRSLLRGNGKPAPPPPKTTETPPARERISCLRCDKPEYPTEARNRNLQGQAKVAVDVDSNGNVINVRLLQSSGHGELDRAALQQARRWQFSPSTTGKQGISGRVDFQLEGSEYQRQRRQETVRKAPAENQTEPSAESPIEPPPPTARETVPDTQTDPHNSANAVTEPSAPIAPPPAPIAPPPAPIAPPPAPIAPAPAPIAPPVEPAN